MKLSAYCITDRPGPPCRKRSKGKDRSLPLRLMYCLMPPMETVSAVSMGVCPDRLMHKRVSVPQRETNFMLSVSYLTSREHLCDDPRHVNIKYSELCVNQPYPFILNLHTQRPALAIVPSYELICFIIVCNAHVLVIP